MPALLEQERRDAVEVVVVVNRKIISINAEVRFAKVSHGVFQCRATTGHTMVTRRRRPRRTDCIGSWKKTRNVSENAILNGKSQTSYVTPKRLYDQRTPRKTAWTLDDLEA
jgi:ribosomal protein L24E